LILKAVISGDHEYMKILLLSAYHAHSHRYWCESLQVMFPEHDWTVLSLPGRYFNWRIRSNALSWCLTNADILNKAYELVVATSMVDCATLRGLVPNLATLSWRVYFHENQFAYPLSGRDERTEPKMVSLYNALCADELVFNSQYNYQTFLLGLEKFLNKMPDHVPANTLEVIKLKSNILEVPIRLPGCKVQMSTVEPVLVWNHRWEYDKGPTQLLYVLLELKKRGFAFKLNLIGQQFRSWPGEFDQIKNIFSKELNHYGFIEEADQYYEIISSSSMILSTAIHEFQGVAVLEAVARGCIPVVPDRLVYKEIFPEVFRYKSDTNNIRQESVYMADKIIELWMTRLNNKLEDFKVVSLGFDAMKARYTKLLLSV